MAAMDEAPLLVNIIKSSSSSAADDAAAPRTYAEAREAFVREAERLWVLAAPITLNILCLYGVNSSTQLFAARLGNLQLSAAAVSLSVVSNLSFGFLLGMASALETLCGQAYGAGRPAAALGLYTQRSCLVLAASALLLTPLYACAGPILRCLLGHEAIAIAAAAGEFSLLTLPQMFSLALAFPTQKLLQAQGRVAVLAWISAAALAAHVAMLALFVSALGWGLRGAAAAYDVTAWGVAAAQVAYVTRWSAGWEGLTWEAFDFRGLWAFAKLSLASAVMLCLEVWYMMVLVLLTGRLDHAEIAVGSVSICMNLNGWEAMVFLGLNAAISVRVSNELGSGRPRAAKQAVAAVLVQSVAMGVVAMALVLAYRNSLAALFTPGDREMQAAVGKVAYLLAATMVLNSVQPVISGVAIGVGWQALVAYINLGCYYALGLPLGFFMGYVLEMGPQGIWAGMLCGTALQTVILLAVIWNTDWEAEAAQASQRISAWGGDDGDYCESKQQHEGEGETGGGGSSDLKQALVESGCVRMC